MAFLVERMEKCLRAWEDLWFLLGVLKSASEPQGDSWAFSDENAMVHWPYFRKCLLAAGQGQIDIEKFLPPKHENFASSVLANLAVPLSQWCLNSRRVYHLSEELQFILDATSLEGVTWKDVHLPFPAYAMKLDRPFIDSEGTHFDFIMVTTFLVENQKRVLPAIELIFLAKDCDQYEPMNEGNRNTIRTYLKNRQYDRAEKLSTRFFNKLDIFCASHLEIWGDDFDEEVIVSAQRHGDQYQSKPWEEGSVQAAVHNWDSMIRIVVGMCLYLKTLPSGSPHQSEWRLVPRSGLPDPKAISNEAQVCTVSSCYKLTTQERVMLGLEGTKEEKAAYELSCHFRAGHWRRPPGSGHDPTAQKTVHVRPCIVRKDRLREGELPGGAGAIVVPASIE